MTGDTNEKPAHVGKSKEEHEKRKEKVVNLSDYIKKSDGTLVPKPKVIANLRGVRPRQGGFMAKKLTEIDTECSTRKCKDLFELRSLMDNKNQQKPTQVKNSKTLNFSSYCNLADLDMNPVDEDNIVDHFERLMHLMKTLSETSRNIKKKQAHGVIEFLESIKTPHGQLAPNAQALVHYIEHLLNEKRGEKRNASNTHEGGEDNDSDSDGGHSDRDEDTKRKRNTPICLPKTQKSCPTDDKESKAKDKPVDISKKTSDHKGENKSKEGGAIQHKMGDKQESQEKNSTRPDNPKNGNNKPVVGFVHTNPTPCECQPKTIFGVTLKPFEENKKCCELAKNQFQVTAKDLIIMNKDKVQKVEAFTDYSTNLNEIGDNLCCGEEVLQRCYEPASRSQSPSNTSSSNTYEYDEHS